MSRPLRIYYPDAMYHVTVRGNNGGNIFFCDKDRLLFLRILARVIKRDRLVCHAYCLMENHYHLLLQTPEANLSEGMRNINGMYAQKCNERHRRFGHVFQGRFKAFLIESEQYFLAVARYIVLNPVRAGIVESPTQYRWSSFRQTAGTTKISSFLTRHDILASFSPDYITARMRYQDFIYDGIGKESPFLKMKYSILGSAQFIAERGISEQSERNVEVKRENRMIGRPNLEDIFEQKQSKKAREAAINFAVIYCRYSQSLVAQHLGLHYSTVSRILKKSRFKT